MDKPRADTVRPELTRLPRLNPRRRFFRKLVKLVFRLMILILTRPQVKGLKNVPAQGGALIVINHLGDADAVLAGAYFPRMLDALAKMELYDFPILGKIMESYGVIWVHRGTPDRRALRAALTGLEQGRLMTVAPEGRQSLTGGLEEGTGGASYLALRSGLPVIPVVFTGTENRQIYSNLKRLRRTPVTMTVGPAFYLQDLEDRKQAIELGTETIMQSLAALLPARYQGVYRKDTPDSERL